MRRELFVRPHVPLTRRDMTQVNIRVQNAALPRSEFFREPGSKSLIHKALWDCCEGMCC